MRKLRMSGGNMTAAERDDELNPWGEEQPILTASINKLDNTVRITTHVDGPVRTWYLIPGEHFVYDFKLDGIND